MRIDRDRLYAVLTIAEYIGGLPDGGVRRRRDKDEGAQANSLEDRVHPTPIGIVAARLYEGVDVAYHGRRRAANLIDQVSRQFTEHEDGFIGFELDELAVVEIVDVYLAAIGCLDREDDPALVAKFLHYERDKLHEAGDP